MTWQDDATRALQSADLDLAAKGYSAALRDLALRRAVNWSGAMAGRGPVAQGENFAAILAEQLTGAEAWLAGNVEAAEQKRLTRELRRAERDGRYAAAAARLGGLPDGQTVDRYHQSVDNAGERWSERFTNTSSEG